MFSFLTILTMVGLLSRVLAFDTFNVTVGSPTKTTELAVTAILSFPANPASDACSSVCGAAGTTINACNSEATCLCSNATVSDLLNCEQCLFNFVVNSNVKAVDYRVGSTPVLAGYSAACAASNITLSAAQTALQLPPDWEGPFDVEMPVGAGIVVTLFGAVLGISGISLLFNM